MNNRYTFKAKRKDNGEWVYGWCLYLGATISPYRIYYFDCGVLAYCEVIKETLCQCTGLQDIEGNYIFENDIFNTFDKNGNIISTFVIIWNEIEISYEILDYNTKNHFTFDSRCMLKKCKVIGNKFDEVK